MEVFIAIGASHALYITILLLLKKSKGFSDIILSIVFGVFTLAYTSGYLSYALQIDDFRVFLWNIGMLIPQLIYLYIKQLFYGRKQISLLNILHFAPWVLSTTYLITIGFIYTSKEMVILLNNSNYINKPILYTFFCFSELVLTPIYIILIFKTIGKFRKKLNKNYSYSEGIDLLWIKKISIAILVFWFIVYGFYSSSLFDYISEADSIKYAFAISVFVVFYIGYYGLKQVNVQFAVDINNNATIEEDSNKIETSKVKYQKTKLSSEKANSIMNCIDEYMIKEKPYLNQKLSIQQLSDSLNIPSHHISQVLNDVAGKSFFSYINTLRVKAFIEKVNNNEHQTSTLLGLAYDCGFNSKSSFNRLFKELKGVSPSEYIKQSQNSNT